MTNMGFKLSTWALLESITEFPFAFRSLSVGAIGSILGHELTHGFDNTGKYYLRCNDQRRSKCRSYKSTTTVVFSKSGYIHCWNLESSLKLKLIDYKGAACDALISDTRQLPILSTPLCHNCACLILTGFSLNPSSVFFLSVAFGTSSYSSTCNWT